MRPLRPVRLPFVLLAGLVLSAGVFAAPRERLALRLTQIELPGAPAAIVPADVDGDGVRDLAVVIAYTEWDQLKFDERSEMDDVQGLVEMLTIVPALLDRRELRLFLGDAEGGYRPAGPPLGIDRSILSLEAGPPGYPVVALTDDGLAALRLAGAEIRLEPVLAERPLLARTGNFVSGLGLVRDLDGDGRRDVLLPMPEGAAVYLAAPDALTPASRVPYPLLDEAGPTEDGTVLHYPLPEVGDVDGDGRPDLVMRSHKKGWKGLRVLLGTGEGRFAAPRAPFGEEDDEEKKKKDEEKEKEIGSVVWFGDLDGDGKAEYVTEQDLSAVDAGWRKELKEAKRPPSRIRLFHAADDLTMTASPYTEFETLGYAFEGEDSEEERRWFPGGFQDLDGDGRLDLVTVTLDFSLLQAVRVLTVRSISIGIDFHLWCQLADGSFRAVQGLDLSGKFNLDLDNLRIGQLSQFAGDFDGDGRADFVQMGRGRRVTIHRGRAGCAYAPEPDLAIELEEEPRDLALARVEDFDGDGLADLLVIQPQKVKQAGATAPVRLDLYVSGGGAE